MGMPRDKYSIDRWDQTFDFDLLSPVGCLRLRLPLQWLC